VNDDFHALLERGSSLLASGDLDAARDAFVAALALRPDDAGARGFLAQAEYKRGDHDAAAAIYDGLVRDRPDDPTLRVNLGLAHLKAGRLDVAVREFRTACDLAPDHRKARRYLGLALARRGDPAAAREEFARAGEAELARRMEDLLAGPGEGAGPAAAAVGPTAIDGDGALAQVASGGLSRLEVEDQPFAPAEEGAAPAEGWRPGEPAEEAPRGSPGLLPEPPARVPTLAAFVELARLPPPPDGPFSTGPFGAAIQVRGSLITRLDGVYAARGALGFEPMQQRFRGRPTERPFGEGVRQVFRATGQGSLLVSPQDPAGGARTLAALRLADEEAFFCEGPVFAFDESLDHENGRVPGPPADLPLLRLRGRGHVLLATPGRVRSIRVTGEPLRVPSSRLVGWTGALAPRLLPLEGAPSAGFGVGVELAGEGEVLVVP
jgi:hypothetical protein